jgi:hypothetical protein
MAVAEMIVRNVGRISDPDELDLMVGYVRYVLAMCRPTFRIAKQWHDHIFRPRYYYTTCSDTLDILARIDTTEMTRHVIPIQSAVLPSSSMYLLEVEAIARQVLDAGYTLVYYVGTEAFLMKSSHDVFKAASIELILEGRPFEQEYVTDLSAFQVWLTKRLPVSPKVK